MTPTQSRFISMPPLAADVSSSHTLGQQIKTEVSDALTKQYIRPIRKDGRCSIHRDEGSYEPHIQPISCHVASLPWQEPEEEFNNLILTKRSKRLRKYWVVNIHTNSRFTLVIYVCGGEKLAESSKQSAYGNDSSITAPFTRSLYVSRCSP